MTSYFISDVHLGLGAREVEKRKEDRLLAFLTEILPSTDRLFVVGDLFDFWFEYRTVIPKGFHRTLAALQQFTDRGIRVDYLLGNHDYWVDDYFEKELGMEVHAKPYETILDGKRFYLHHGDGLATHDLGYKLIKPVLRSRLSFRAYRWLHPDWGVRIARGSSRTSRAYTSQKDFGEDAGMLAHAREAIARGVDVVVMGHRHEPRLIQLDRGTYVNLGDWINHATYGRFADGSMSLNTWNGKQE
jgi:UDP-2,3-diacylglucosamine hydrolase